ncbi:MAG: DUF1801 domain-containing protein [Phycisphaerales bacterium]
MKSSAATVEQYLASLPEDRRAAVSSVRRFILANLSREFEECMQYGVIGYCVPHSIWPHGHHTNPKLPLMYMGLSSQKNDMVVYMLFLLHNKPEREWFDKAWSATARKNHLEVSGAGCCLRFKKLDDLALDVIGAAMRRMPLAKYLEDHIATLARLGKGPDGKPMKPKGREVRKEEKSKGATAPSRKKLDKGGSVAKRSKG